MSALRSSQLLWFPSVFILILGSNAADAGIIQWRVRVPEGADNPTNLGSFTNTIEIGNGGTTAYNPGLDYDLDTSIVPNERFFVTYIDQNPNKVEYEFTQELQPGESYTAFLSFENNGGGGSAFTQNTIEFLVADGNFTYELSVDTNDNGSVDTFRSGTVNEVIQGIGEITPWNQLIFLGNDHRNGWYYGTLTITAEESAPVPNADFNLSGAVDGEDLSLWASGYGIISGATLGNGDSDSDLDVDGADFLHWQRQYGSRTLDGFASDHSSIQAIPEPSTLVGVLTGLAFVVACRLWPTE